MKTALLALALACSGCAQMLERQYCNDPAEIAAKVEVTHDGFKKRTAYVGPSCGNLYNNQFLRAFKHDGDLGEVYQAYVQATRDDWLFLDRAYGEDGTVFSVTVISREVVACGRTGCSDQEDVGVSIPLRWLESHRETGFRLKVAGTRGEVIKEFSPGYVQGFMGVVEKDR